MGKKVYQILVTGLSVSGKTNFASCLESILSGRRLTINNDIDHKETWRNSDFGGKKGYHIIQTPHGIDTEKEDGINLEEIDRIAYILPSRLTHLRLLINRGLAWYREGVTEHPYDKEPTPKDSKLILPITKNLIKYWDFHRKHVQRDMGGFEKRGIKSDIIVPYFYAGDLQFEGYDTLLYNIFSDTGQIKGED